MFEEWHLVESAQIRIFLQRRFTWNRSNRIDFFFFFAVKALPGDYKKGFECISQKVI